MTMREKIARAICVAYGDDFDEQPVDLAALSALRPDGIRSNDPGLPTQADWLDMADAALAALEEPTYGVLKAGWDVTGHANVVWRAMIAAAKEG